MNHLGSLSDDELMQCLKSGQGEALQVIYERHSAKAWRFINKRAPADLKEDIFQDCFLKLCEKRNSWNGQPFLLWFYVVIRNTIYDSYRKKALFSKYSETMYSEIDVPEKEFAEILESLSEDKAMILKQYFYDGQSHKDLAKIYDLPEVTLRKRLSRALLILKKELSG